MITRLRLSIGSSHLLGRDCPKASVSRRRLQRAKPHSFARCPPSCCYLCVVAIAVAIANAAYGIALYNSQLSLSLSFSLANTLGDKCKRRYHHHKPQAVAAAAVERAIVNLLLLLLQDSARLSRLRAHVHPAAQSARYEHIATASAPTAIARAFGTDLHLCLIAQCEHLFSSSLFEPRISRWARRSNK